ncbi:PAS domain-containing protein [Albimonas pacifica]|uniref:PAS domain S-box-containing protein n=1 Tax=Albimonas pacifica TaxID=1114924 RepID=A0A1I3C3A4_9RHOB|nr:PAS domain-containing protein [Albimonas pacifica]SFH68471.1 PAS domain S-box-containing protein [Albimonas pacifica]
MPHRALKDSSFDRLKEDRTITAAEATRNFGRLQEEVAGGPITLTHHGRARMILLSPEQYEALGGEGAAADPPRVDGISFVLDEMEEGFIALDQDDRFAAVNRVAEFYFGRAREDLLGRAWHEALPNVGRSGMVEIIEGVRAQGRPRRLSWDSVIRDGRRLEMNIFPIPNARGWIGVVFTNIGEVEQLSREAAVAQGVIDMLLAALPGAALAVVDTAGLVMDWRGAASDLLGWSPGEIVGQPMERLAPEDGAEQGRLWVHIAEARRKGVAHCTGPRLARDGSVVEVDCTTTWLPEPDVFVCVMRRAQ